MSESDPDVRPPAVTVVTPVFNEEACLPRFVEAVERVLLSRTDTTYRVLFVDDGSTDKTWSMISELCSASDRFRGLRLSRNFGSHIAATAGIDVADGDAVAILPVDLQDPPETIVEFTAAWEAGADVVWGHRLRRDESRWRILLSRAFSFMIGRFALPRGSRFATGSFLLIDRKVVDCFRQLREHNRVVFGLVAWTGFDQAVVTYDRKQRVAGRTSWSAARLVGTMYDTLVGFSPIIPRMVTMLGLVFSILGILAAAYWFVWALISEPLPGWSGIMVTVALLFGINFFILGMMSEYLSRIYGETTQRPLYFVASDTASPTDRRTRP